MKKPPQDMKALAVRRANVVDADKVRYRVYRTPTDFIAVIAENALMAVRVAGITNPHKIVRDLPTEGIAIEAQRLSTLPDDTNEKVLFGVERREKQTLTVTPPSADQVPTKESLFKPMAIGDLQREGRIGARIIPPDLLLELIEDHAKAHNAATHAAAPVPPAAPASAPPPPITAAALPPAASTPQERLLAAAAAMPHSPPTPPSAHTPTETLSAEEVEKLLHGKPN
jgi:hypothetical protein